MQEKTPLITIERAVAFAIGPVVAAGAGWVSTFLATRLGINESSEAIVGVFAVGEIGAFRLADKWLGGRQKDLEAKALPAIRDIGNVAGGLGVSPATRSGIVHIAYEDLMKLVDRASSKAASDIKGAEAKLTEKQPIDAGSATSGVLVTDPPIDQAPNDPAPPGTPIVGTSGDGTAAGAGAAPAQ